MPEESTISTSMRLPESLHWKFKEVATARRISDTAALRQAIAQWIESEPSKDAGPRRTLELPEGLSQKSIEILESAAEWMAQQETLAKGLLYLEGNMKQMLTANNELKNKADRAEAPPTPKRKGFFR